MSLQIFITGILLEFRGKTLTTEVDCFIGLENVNLLDLIAKTAFKSNNIFLKLMY